MIPGEPQKYPEYDRQIEMPRNRFGAVTLENTKDITQTNLHLRETGYMGIYALFANEGLKVTNNLFENIAAGAIKVEGGWPGEGDLSHEHTISNVFIDHVGELVPGDAPGIELMGTGDNVIEHVFMNHSARYGISLASRPEVKDRPVHRQQQVPLHRDPQRRARLGRHGRLLNLRCGESGAPPGAELGGAEGDR